MTTTPAPETPRRGMVGRLVDRLSTSSDRHEAEDLQHDSARAGCTLISGQADRCVATVHGTIRTVTLRPRGGVAALEADLYDGSGSVTVVWLGRRRIPGIGPGRHLTVHGRLGTRDGERVLFNPRYELTS